MSIIKAPTVIDLFCGAGGLTSALESAGWRSLAAVDIDPEAIESLREVKARRIQIGGSERSFLQGTRLICSDIRDAEAREKLLATLRGGELDLLAGGPPCQPFSSAGLMRSVADPRGKLFQSFVEAARLLKPRFILFENVAGIVTAKGSSGEPGAVLRSIQKSFERIGYACRFALLNAADFGAPQRRIRLYMIASKSEELPNFPSPTHSRTPSFLEHPWVTLGEVLTAYDDPVESEVVRPTEKRLSELEALEPGMGIKASGIIEANRPGGHWGYRQDCFLADTALPSRTIRAACTPDWIRDRGGRLRRLTWQECSRLQGFPAGWHFAGTRSSKFRQIGNAVQGDVGRALARTLYDAAQRRQICKMKSPPWPPSFHRRVRYTEMEERVNGLHRAAAREQRLLAEVQ